MSLLYVLQSGKLNKRTGTPLYMAPELFMRYYGVESDQVQLDSCTVTLAWSEAAGFCLDWQYNLF